MTLSIAAAAAFWAVTAVVAGFGAYFGAYLKKKGENFATHEDIDRLVEQVRAVTTATKEIESKISNETWDRQKQWELKREMIIGVSNAVSELEEVLLYTHSTVQVGKESQGDEWMEAYHEALTRWRKACAAFDRARMLVVVICSKETADAVNEYGKFAMRLAADITKDKNAGVYDSRSNELAIKYERVRRALRAELGIKNAKL